MKMPLFSPLSYLCQVAAYTSPFPVEPVWHKMLVGNQTSDFLERYEVPRWIKSPVPC